MICEGILLVECLTDCFFFQQTGDSEENFHRLPCAVTCAPPPTSHFGWREAWCLLFGIFYVMKIILLWKFVTSFCVILCDRNGTGVFGYEMHQTFWCWTNFRNFLFFQSPLKILAQYGKHRNSGYETTRVAQAVVPWQERCGGVKPRL